MRAIGNLTKKVHVNTDGESTDSTKKVQNNVRNKPTHKPHNTRIDRVLSVTNDVLPVLPENKFYNDAIKRNLSWQFTDVAKIPVIDQRIAEPSSESYSKSYSKPYSNLNYLFGNILGKFRSTSRINPTGHSLLVKTKPGNKTKASRSTPTGFFSIVPSNGGNRKTQRRKK